MFGNQQGQLPGQAPGQEPVNVPQGQEQAPGKQPEYITREEATRLAQQAAEEAYRKAQGLFDKGRDGILKKVQSDLQALTKSLELQKQAGFQITPDQESALRNQVIQRALSEPEAPAPPQPSSNQPAQAGTQGAEDNGAPHNEYEAAAFALFDSTGILIEQTDPEAAQLDNSSGPAWLTSVAKAIEAKRTRLASPPQPPQQQAAVQTTAQQPPARTPTNAGSYGAPVNPIANINDPQELLRMALGTGRK
jgi:hypothetical protein